MRDQDDLGQDSKPQAMPSRRQRKRDRKRKAAAMDELSEGEDGSDSHSDAEEVDDAPEVDSDDEPAGAPCWVFKELQGLPLTGQCADTIRPADRCCFNACRSRIPQPLGRGIAQPHLEVPAKYWQAGWHKLCDKQCHKRTCIGGGGAH